MTEFKVNHWWLLMAVGTAAIIAWPRERADSQESPTFDAGSVEFFTTKVKPLLEARCFECHGPDAKEPKGGLSLASRAAMLKGGDSGAAMVPGKPDESLLIKAVKYIDFEMPPKSRMPDGEIAILTEWVKRGAPWSKEDTPIKEAKPELFPMAERKASHWCWKPIGHFEPPNVRWEGKAPAEPGRTTRPSTSGLAGASPSPDDIDKFVMAKLEEKGLSHAAPADRHTLLRRVYFSLIGLPPTPAEADEFINDPAPTRDALARVVDRLLDSPHFGERWARHWLDLVRYAETLGHEFDYPLHHAYQYRDYVIRALNADVPYDRFVVEHVAGDLLRDKETRRQGEGEKNQTQPPSSLPFSLPPPLPLARLHPTDGYNESLLATGFWFLGEDKHAPVDVKGEQAARIDNQLDVFSKAFLALTVACARCHDHKFDALTTRDYYALSGFLQSSRRQTAYLDPDGKIDAVVAELKKRRQQSSNSTNSTIMPHDLSDYLLAARDVLYGTPKPEDSPASSVADEVFDDFESERFSDKWIAEGPAFERTEAGTSKNQMPVSGFEGQRLLNSYLGNDGHTGKLTSKSFVIRHAGIRFLIGGGNHAGKTSFNLKVGGQVVLTATGKNDERLEPAAWDVSRWLGKEAVLEVIDDHRGGWGHINLDQIVFTNAKGLVTKRPVEVVARERKLDLNTLHRWVSLLQSDAVKSPSHPLWTWHELSQLPADATPEQFLAKKKQLAERVAAEQKRADETTANAQPFANFRSTDFVDLQHPAPLAATTSPKAWYATGWAFGEGPNRQGIAHSGELHSRLQGVLRSPTFTITHPQILYRVAARNARIRLVIDGYQMMDFSGLLFGGTTFDVNTDGRWVWHRQGGDLQNYLGRRAYIELIDDNDGWIACEEIRFSKGGPEPVPAPHVGHAKLLSDDSIASLEKLANAVSRPSERGGVSSAVESLIADGNEGFTPPRSPSDEVAIPAPVRAIAICDGNAINEHVFIRGNHKNLGQVVARRDLEALGGRPIEAAGSGRLQLAMRLIDAKANPLVPRVAVNRVWHHLFGRGIVETVDNFGVLGKEPTHPELLDYLAETFVADGWSLKRLIRRIVLTNTWQMANHSEPRDEELDPQNLWLHRAPIQRLEGEAIRDAMLLISGRLNRQTFGPSVPVYLTPFMQGRGRPGTSGPLDGDGRRSIYTSVNRNFLSPMMLAFDTPIPFTAIGRRNVSNVPAQALILLNDPFVLDMSKRWAERSLKEYPDLSPEARIERLYLEAFTRSPSESERADALAFLQEQAKSFSVPADTWPKHAPVWSDLCHVLFNVKEFVFVK